MNKNNKILVGILTFVVVCVVGYALFSDNINITGTATASGQMMLVPSCQVITTDSVYLNHDVTITGYKSTGTGTCKIEDGVIKTTSTLSKPTDVVNFNVEIYNADSNEFPIILKKITSPNNMNASGAAGDIIYGDINTGLAAWYSVFDINESTSNCGYASNSIRGNSAVNNEKIIIKSDCHLNIIITHQWADTDALGLKQPEIPAGGATINYDLALDFEQYIK